MYLGQEPTVGSYDLVTVSEAFNGSRTAFTMSKSVASANQLMIILSGVTQHWGEAFTVSGTTLTFTSAPPTGSTIRILDFGRHVLDVGTPTDGTITTAKLADDAVTDAKSAIRSITDADNNTKVQVEESADENKIRFDTAGSQRMIIDASGNVGVGETTPLAKVHIKTSDCGLGSLNGSADELFLENSGSDSAGLTIASGTNANGLIVFGDADSNYRGAISYDHSIDAMKFITVAAEQMRIDNAGNLLFNKTDANASSSGIALRKNDRVQIYRGGDGNSIEFFRSTSQVGSISVTGTSTAYNTSSDYRLKENIVPLDGAIDRIKQFNPYRFNFIDDGPSRVVDGFVAHEVSEIVPEAISGEKDAMRTEEYTITPAVEDESGTVTTEAVMGEREVPDYQGIDQAKLVPLTIAALQEALAKIETLEAKVATLEAK